MEQINKYIIYSDSNSHRLIDTLRELKKINLNYNINLFEEDKCKIKKNYVEYISLEAYKNIENPTNNVMLHNFKSLDCAISHIGVWRNMIEKNIPDALIFENNIMCEDKYKFQIELNNILKYTSVNKSTSFFISFNSILSNTHFSFFGINNNQNITLNNDLKKIKQPFIGMYAYYINLGMVQYLISKITTLKYQLDITIGLLSKKELFNNKKFFTYTTNSIRTRTKQLSEFESFKLSTFKISKIIKLPYELSKFIYEFIPDMYKQDRLFLLDNYQFRYDNYMSLNEF